MPLHVDYRPTTLDEIYGNEKLVESIRGAINADSPFHTFLITGPSGCGKTTIARIIKNELNISDWDYKYFNASNTRGIDTVREVLQGMLLSPMEGQHKLYVFDECHQLTPHAQEALLKDTEEPPEHVYFVFCTTEPDKLKPSFKRRGFQAQVEKLLRKDVINLMKEVLNSELEFYENKTPVTDAIEDMIAKLRHIPDDLFVEIVNAADGSPGQALKLLDQVIRTANMEDARGNLQGVFGDEASILDLARTIGDQRIQTETKWKKCQGILASLASESEAIRKGILTYLGKVMLGQQASPEIAMMIVIFEDSTMYSYKAGLIRQCYEACAVGAKE
jgi:DNA polymerase III gamma/tau subunit